MVDDCLVHVVGGRDKVLAEKLQQTYLAAEGVVEDGVQSPLLVVQCIVDGSRHGGLAASALFEDAGIELVLSHAHHLAGMVFTVVEEGTSVLGAEAEELVAVERSHGLAADQGASVQIVTEFVLVLSGQCLQLVIYLRVARGEYPPEILRTDGGGSQRE